MNPSAVEAATRLEIDPAVFAESFDYRPFALRHSLHTHPAFDFDSLLALASRYSETKGDAFVSASAPAAGSAFFAPRHSHMSAVQAIKQLDVSATRILLKRPEQRDPRFRALLDALFAQIVDLRGGLGSERVERLDSSIFITSSESITPFHFDPEIAFFFQIEGDKVYHVYAPQVMRDEELERFYLQGATVIGEIPLQGRDPALLHDFVLGPGKGLHQPQDSPHWVETRGVRSISYSFVFETNRTRMIRRARAFNHYVRKAGLDPQVPGTRPRLDAIKSGSMRALIPMRQRASRLLRTLRLP